MSTSGLRCPGAKWQREDPANVLGSVWASLNISHDVDRELLCTGLIPCHGPRETLQITPRQQQQGLSTLHSPLAKSVFSKAPGRQGAGPEGRCSSTMGDQWPSQGQLEDFALHTRRLHLLWLHPCPRIWIPMPGCCSHCTGQQTGTTVWKSWGQPCEHWGCFGGLQARPCPSKQRASLNLDF